MKHPVVKLLWMIAGVLGLVWIFLATLQKEIPSAVYLVLLVLAFLSALAAICLATLHDKPKHYRWRMAGYGAIFCVLVARIGLAVFPL